MTETLLMHATTVAVDGGAILLRGPSGSGKSDLALRLIDGGAQLVADDQTVLRRVGDRVLAAAPPTIAGLIEIRGIGIVKLDMADPVPLLLIADLVAPREVIREMERIPTRSCETVLGVSVALIALAPFEASAAAKLRLLRRALAADPLPAIIGA
jgi:HPr kinase/phosphorylase